MTLMEDVLLNALIGLTWNTDFDLEHSDNIASPEENAQTIQHSLDHLHINECRHGFYTCFSKIVRSLCLHLPFVAILTINSPDYLGSWITTRGGVAEFISRTVKAKTAFANPRHLWHCHDIRI